MRGSKLSELAIQRIENTHSGYVINVIVAGKNGTADLIACIQGRFFAFEIKGDGDSRKRLQDEKLMQIARAGGYGGYVKSIADVDTIICNLLRPEKLVRKNIVRL